MKPMILIACMLSAILLLSATVETTTSGKIATKKSGCNKGSGFCLKSSVAKESELLINLRYDNVSNTLSIIIDENELIRKQPDALILFKDKTNFTFEEDIILPSEIISLLKINRELVKKGSYLLQYANGKFIIIIPK